MRKEISCHMILSILDFVKRRPHAALGSALALCLCVVSVCLYLYRPLERTLVSEDGLDSASGADLQEIFLQRTVERNALESRGQRPAAVRSVGAPIEVVQDVAEDDAAEDRAAPAGYSLIWHPLTR